MKSRKVIFIDGLLHANASNTLFKKKHCYLCFLRYGDLENTLPEVIQLDSK